MELLLSKALRDRVVAGNADLDDILAAHEHLELILMGALKSLQVSLPMVAKYVDAGMASRFEVADLECVHKFMSEHFS